jgi:Family of unknown function (DUF6459)
MGEPHQATLPLVWAPRGVATIAEHPVPGSAAPLDRWVGRICAAVAEIACGDRPPQQLFRVVHPTVLTRLRVLAGSQRASNSPIRRVTSVRVTHTSPRTIEACAVVQGARRSQAVAIQLRRRQRGWLVTAVEIR